MEKWGKRGKHYNFLPLIDRVNYKGFGKFQLKSAYKDLGSPLTSTCSEISEEHYIAMNTYSAKNTKSLASIVELAWNMQIQSTFFFFTKDSDLITELEKKIISAWRT